MNEIFGILFMFLATVALAIPLGRYMGKVFGNEKTWLDFLFNPIDKLFYKLSGIDASKEMNWKERSAWIIGASSGIGESLADELERKGCRVVRSARSKGDILIDVADDQSVINAANEYQNKYGDFDIVVVMAGYWKRMTAKNFDFLLPIRCSITGILGRGHFIKLVAKLIFLKSQVILYSLGSFFGLKFN